MTICADTKSAHTPNQNGHFRCGQAKQLCLVQPGSPILTFSAFAEKIDKIEINPATSVVLIIFIYSPYYLKIKSNAD